MNRLREAMMNGLLFILVLSMPLAAFGADASSDPIRAAVAKSLRRIETGSARYITHRQCFSCHHQALSILSLRMARERQLPMEAAKLRALASSADVSGIAMPRWRNIWSSACT